MGEYFLIALGETQIHLTATGVLLVLVVLFMPEGIIARIARRRAGAASIREDTADQRLQEATR